MSLAEISKNILVKPTEPIENRDDRFRNILRRQFGDHGIEIVAYQGFVFMVIMLFIMTIILTTLPMNAANQTLFTLGTPQKYIARPTTTPAAISIR